VASGRPQTSAARRYRRADDHPRCRAGRRPAVGAQVVVRGMLAVAVALLWVVLSWAGVLVVVVVVVAMVVGSTVDGSTVVPADFDGRRNNKGFRWVKRGITQDSSGREGAAHEAFAAARNRRAGVWWSNSFRGCAFRSSVMALTCSWL
jgi:hypothetical protein